MIGVMTHSQKNKEPIKQRTEKALDIILGLDYLTSFYQNKYR